MSKKLMTEAHRHRLNKSRVYFTQHLIVNVGLLDILSDDYTLTPEFRQEIEVIFCCLLE
jgi:hypothetical protein